MSPKALESIKGKNVAIFQSWTRIAIGLDTYRLIWAVQAASSNWLGVRLLVYLRKDRLDMKKRKNVKIYIASQKHTLVYIKFQKFFNFSTFYKGSYKRLQIV